MSFKKTEYRGGKIPFPEEDPKKCAAYGCKCRSVARVDGGSWCCSNHAHAPVDDWQTITRRLSENDWLSGLIDEVQKMHRTNQDWRGFSCQFWANSDPICAPQKYETAPVYEYRMRGELQYRTGQLSSRPLPSAPGTVKPGGYFS